MAEVLRGMPEVCGETVQTAVATGTAVEVCDWVAGGIGVSAPHPANKEASKRAATARNGAGVKNLRESKFNTRHVQTKIRGSVGEVCVQHGGL